MVEQSWELCRREDPCDLSKWRCRLGWNGRSLNKDGAGLFTTGAILTLRTDRPEGRETILAASVAGFLALQPSLARAERTAVQEVPCVADGERQLGVDGTVLACRLAAAATLQAAPSGGNGGVACAAGSSVEFHRSGYLAFCGVAEAPATYRGLSGRETRCRAGARLAFGEGGFLDYCS